jgi:hypothetical protein
VKQEKEEQRGQEFGSGWIKFDILSTHSSKDSQESSSLFKSDVQRKG